MFYVVSILLTRKRNGPRPTLSNIVTRRADGHVPGALSQPLREASLPPWGPEALLPDPR